jgi:hypothetical protein
VADVAIEALVDQRAVIAALERAQAPSEQFPFVLASTDRWRQRLRSDTDGHDALLRLVDRVELSRNSFRVSVNLGALLESADREIILARESAPSIKRRGVETRLVLESGPPKEAKVDQVLLREVARAHCCFEALLAELRQSKRQPPLKASTKATSADCYR